MGPTSISIPALLKGTTHAGLVSIPIALQFFPNIWPLQNCKHKRIHNSFHHWDLLVSSNGTPKSRDYNFSPWIAMMHWVFKMPPVGQLHRGLTPENSEVTNSSLSCLEKSIPFESTNTHWASALHCAGTFRSESALPSNLAERLMWQESTT